MNGKMPSVCLQNCQVCANRFENISKQSFKRDTKDVQLEKQCTQAAWEGQAAQQNAL